MKEYIELGSAPCDEACVQVDSRREYLPAMVEECRRYKKLLEEMFSGLGLTTCELISQSKASHMILEPIKKYA